MESREYYDMLFKENRENHWDDAPGKKVILSASINLINEQANNILDIGCGNGYFIGEIKKCNRVKDHEQNYYGIDISETAVKAAKKRYPDIVFKSVDITKTSLNYASYNCIIMTECIWCILPHLKYILSQIHDGLKTPRGVFVLNNHLYQDSEQKYGREYITTIETLIEKLPFKIEYIVENNRFENYDVTAICKPSN